MQYSTNYNLNKPQPADQFNIEHWNQNSDTIDSQMHANEVGIATNKENISTIIANLTSNKSSDSGSTYFKLMKLIYPVGSIYWSGNSSNPSTLFGGTWVQIKDRFVWAKGDSDTVNATGGSKTVTLTTSNMPSHTHSFTPSGTIKMNSHYHGLNNHTHSFTPSGSVSSTFSGDTKGFYAGSADGHESTEFASYTPYNGVTITLKETPSVGVPYQYAARDRSLAVLLKWASSGTVSSEFTGTAGTTGANSGNTTSVTSTGSFTGTAGTTGASGSGTAVNIMPPYVVKYCWERVS